LSSIVMRSKKNSMGRLRCDALKCTDVSVFVTSIITCC
jgi:hypothetical protein